MLARALRVGQLIELAACLALGAWLHTRYAWSGLGVALGVVAWLAGSRLAAVALTTFLAWIHRSPRAPGERIGIPGGLRLVAGEWRALLAANFLYLPWPASALRPDPEPVRAARVPVILLHGYVANRGYFRPLVRRLEARGIAPIFVPTARGVLYPIESYTEELHRHIERIVAGTGQPRVALVGHSMGGLVARAYVARHGAGRVARLVTLGTPHHGSWLARLGPGANAREMRPGSAFLAALERGESQARSPVAASIYSPHDNMVMPQASARVEGARNVAIPGVGHIAMLRSPRLAAALLAELEEAGAASGR
jgi:triacylglycerol esterase/lipase EstA (alpha/beta hydrolase family)